jgi:hypothetical protein
VSQLALLTTLLLVLGCSDLTEEAGGVVALEIRTPEILSLEIGETLPLTATALDKDGNPVAADVAWRTPDATLSVDPVTGVITGVSAGPGRVQAFVGQLASSLVQFTVIPRADTLIVTDSVFTVAPEVLASPPLVAHLQSHNPTAVLPERPVVYAVTSPPDVGPHTVELPGGVLTDTVNTGTDGAVSTVTLNRVSSIAQPDTAIVEVRAFRTRGAPVPGSGQRFIVIFQ